jgi:hypothetical protein
MVDKVSDEVAKPAQERTGVDMGGVGVAFDAWKWKAESSIPH